MTAARDNIILVVVNLDTRRKQHSYVDVPVDQFGQMESDAYEVHDLLSDALHLAGPPKLRRARSANSARAYFPGAPLGRRRSICLATGELLCV